MVVDITHLSDISFNYHWSDHYLIILTINNVELQSYKHSSHFLHTKNYINFYQFLLLEILPFEAKIVEKLILCSPPTPLSNAKGARCWLCVDLFKVWCYHNSIRALLGCTSVPRYQGTEIIWHPLNFSVWCSSRGSKGKIILKIIFQMNSADALAEKDRVMQNSIFIRNSIIILIEMQVEGVAKCTIMIDQRSQSYRNF